MWTDESVFYQIYPLGAFGCPFENDFKSEVELFAYTRMDTAFKKIRC